MKNCYNNLHNLCRWNMPEQILKVLSQHQDEPLDVTYDEGGLFKIAALNDNYDVLKSLIIYYKQNFIDRYKENNEFYLQKNAERNLSETIQSVVEMGIKLPVEVQDLCDLCVVGQDSASTNNKQGNADRDNEQDSFGEDEDFSLQEFISSCEDSGMKLSGTSVFNSANGVDAYTD